MLNKPEVCGRKSSVLGQVHALSVSPRLAGGRNPFRPGKVNIIRTYKKLRAGSKVGPHGTLPS